MPIVPGKGEPLAGPWRVAPLLELVRLLMSRAALSPGRPWIVAVDGRSAGGKTTLARRLQLAVEGAAVVHTDDIAWNHSRFGWAQVIAEGVLQPLHRAETVHFQPPGWAPNGRAGHIDVAGDVPLAVIEGVGASRRELTPWIDAAVWVQSDFMDAERRGIIRDGGTDEVVRNWHGWMAEELPFLAADRPWERAGVIVDGSNQLAHDRVSEVVLAAGMPSAGASASTAP